MILQTNFNELIAPEFLTQELTILFFALIISMLYAAIKLRSSLGIFGWMLMIVALMVTMFTDFKLLWFWIAVVTETFIIGLAAITYARIAAKDS